MQTELVEKVLDHEGVEVWDGYAVNVYTVRDGDQVITGESFTPLNALQERDRLAAYLGW